MRAGGRRRLACHIGVDVAMKLNIGIGAAKKGWVWVEGRLGKGTGDYPRPSLSSQSESVAGVLSHGSAQIIYDTYSDQALNYQLI